MAKLLDIIISMNRDDIRAISAIIIERGRDKAWQARINIMRDKYQESEMRQGINLQAWERIPDQIYPLDIDEVERDADIRAQAQAVNSSRIIGSLDMARFDRADGITQYIIKSHAGSQDERSKWLFALRQDPRNTIWGAE